MKTINSFGSKLFALALALMASVSSFAYKSQWCDTWNMLVRTGSVYPPSSTPYRYQLAKDTVIGEHTYTAVVQKEINDALDAPHYVAAVRFTDDRKVYIYYDNAEYLLYDFNVQEGDELEVFAGINNYRFGIKTYKCIVTGVEQYACIGCPATITLHVPNHPDDITEIYRRTQWQEGVGDVYSGLLNGVNGYVPVDGGGSVHYLLCAYKGDELKYTGMFHENYGCGDDAEQTPEDLFPTLWGLQQTICSGYYGEEGDEWASGLTGPSQEITMMDGKPYLQWGSWYLREENDKILVYSEIQKKDLVLYDFTLELGDTLTTLNLVTPEFLEYEGIVGIVDYPLSDYDYTYPIDTLVVTELSKETLLDGKEYTRWKFSDGTVYVEGIGSMSETFFHHIADHLPVPVSYLGSYLVCVSKNGQLLYQMDDAEMERLGAECLCEIETSYKSQWCDTWNVMWFDGMRFDETASTTKYRLGKDTIIGDYTYSKFTSSTSVRFTDDRKVYVYYEGFDDNDPYTEDLPTGEYLAYDFSAQVGDTLEVFSKRGWYSTCPCVVSDVQINSETNLRTIKLYPLGVVDSEGNIGIFGQEITWIEGVGSPSGFLFDDPKPGGGLFTLLCAYQDDELKYTGSFYERFGCDYNAGVISDDLFPMLSGLQRTICREYCEQADNKTRIEQFTNLTTRTETGGPYIYCSPFLLREKDNKILIYSRTLNKDLVLYDFNLQVGDSLPMLYIDFFAKDDWCADRDMEIWCVVDYYKDLEGNILPADTLIVTDVSAITLLDGKEYKKWTFDNGMEYVEGIGSFGNRQWSGDFFQLIGNMNIPVSLHGEHLVCASRNGKLIYQMDDAEMERLGAECLCEVETSYKSQWCDTWNVLVSNGSVYPPLEQTYRSQLAQDTIIGGQTYTVLNRYWTDEPNGKKGYMGAVRFSDDRKVYANYKGTEYLIYDFSAQIGDTLEVLRCNDASEILKCLVYDKFVDPQTNRTVITLYVYDEDAEEWIKDEFWAIKWIEGVGAEQGFFEGTPIYTPGAAATDLLCAYKDDELKYTGSLYDEYGCEYNANDPLPLYPWCNQWNILAHGYLGPQEPLYGAKTTIYQLGGDTIINHLRYQQLTQYASDDINQTKTYVGAIRFTKNNRQVYFHYDNAEYLLYDFKAQIGDTLEVFAGIDNYRDNKTYKHVVTNKEPIQDEQCKVTLDVFVSLELEGEIIHEEKFTTTWLEGVGSPDGIVHNCATLREGNFVTDVLCAYVDDRQMYRTPYPDYRILGCEYNDGDFIEGAFPILSGLQRTVCNEYCGETEDDNSANNTYKQTFDNIFFENDKPYILCSGYLLREEENKILIYSQILNKDLVLYDFTLEVGDSLPALYIDYQQRDAMDWMPYNIGVVDYNIDHGGRIYPADTFVVTDVSNVTLLDGKEYKKWTFDNGMEYVEGIGMYGGHRNGDFFRLIREVVVPCNPGKHLVCVSKNNKLLYQMDDAEMERLGAECLCDYDSGPRHDNAKNGKIGGRPTPTQWNMLEVETKEMDGTSIVLRAETFSYTLENDSIIANGKTYYQLARQSTKDTAITKSFVGALHFGEDEDNRVYFLRDGVEYVLYDFTAEPGDTVEIFAGINNYPQHTTYTHVVVDKDTTEDGACRMFLEVVFPDGTASVENAEKVWLAGLGSIDGIVHNAAKQANDVHAAPSRSTGSSDKQTSVMLCAWREDSCLYTTDHPDYDTLGCVYNIDEMTAIEDTHSPSPTTDYQKLFRDGQLLIIHEGKIYNVLGVPVE